MAHKFIYDSTLSKSAYLNTWSWKDQGGPWKKNKKNKGNTKGKGSQLSSFVLCTGHMFLTTVGLFSKSCNLSWQASLLEEKAPSPKHKNLSKWDF